MNICYVFETPKRFFTLFFTVMLLGIGLNLFAYVSGCQCNPEEPTALAPVEVAENWDDGYRGRLKQVCIEGHTYYFSAVRSEFGGAILAPKLQDDGRPVKCGPVVEKP